MGSAPTSLTRCSGRCSTTGRPGRASGPGCPMPRSCPTISARDGACGAGCETGSPHRRGRTAASRAGQPGAARRHDDERSLGEPARVGRRSSIRPLGAVLSMSNITRRGSRRRNQSKPAAVWVGQLQVADLSRIADATWSRATFSSPKTSAALLTSVPAAMFATGSGAHQQAEPAAQPHRQSSGRVDDRHTRGRQVTSYGVRR
jgi:hypothetical protein